jgi:hypothetical protein
VVPTIPTPRPPVYNPTPPIQAPVQTPVQPPTTTAQPYQAPPTTVSNPVTTPAQQPYQPAHQPTYQPPSHPIGMPQTQQVVVKQCMKCKREVPNHLGAGDRCPHCHVYFSHETDEQGNKTTAYQRGGAYAAGEIAGSIFGVILVIAAIIGAVQKFSSR